MRLIQIIFSQGLATILLLAPSLQSKAQDLDEFMRNLVLNEIEDSDITAAEITYQELLQSQGSSINCAKWHQCTSTILMAGLTGQRNSYTNSVLFDIERMDCPDPSGNWWPYLMGNAHFMTNAYEKAADFYSRITWTPDSTDSGFALYINARLNLSSAYNGLNEISLAIETIEDLLETCKSYEEKMETPLDPSLYNSLSINLSGLLISNREFDRSAETLRSVDTSILDSHWLQVVALNRLIIFQETGRFNESDSLWMNELRLSKFAGIPEGTFNTLIRQSLLSNDPIGFQSIRDLIVTHHPHLPQEESFYFSNLVQSDAAGSDFNERWKVYAGIEKERAESLAIQLQTITQINNSRITELTSELKNRADSELQWQMTALVVAFTLVAIVIGHILFQRKKRIENEQKLQDVFSAQSTDSDAEKLHLKSEDIRILGDAIGFGKRTSDAMLILKKISMQLIPENYPRQLDLSSLENFHELSSSEQAILRDMMAGFDAKEIARVMNLSPSHVYNSRSHIRRKLEIPKEQSITDWVINHAVKVDPE